jgi:AraC-like DNA-binding protein
MLASDLAIPSIDSREIYDVARDGIATCNRGGEFFLVGGRFAFAEYADILFGALSPVVHVSASSDQASVLRWGLERFVAEIRNRQPGGLLIAEHLAHIMLVQVPRVHLQSSGPEDVGWMFALSNPRLSAAVSAMHSNLAHRWTLQELARLAGMSRSTFALKFKQAVGTSPLEYLTRWRMLVAVDRLRNGGQNIASIASGLGYESESAFSTAFKRVMSRPPKHYQRKLTLI